MTKDYKQLWKDVTHAIDEVQAVQTLAEILADKEGGVFISRLDNKDAELCIEILDCGIAVHDLKPAEKQAFFVMLRRLAGAHGQLPDCMIITEKIEVSDDILASNGFADLRSGTCMGHRIAVKTMRVATQDDFLKIRKRFCKEVVLWSTLSHPNVMRFVGVYGDMEAGQFATVSEWMVHGNIMEYIKKNHVNRLELLHGAAQGLKYLHGANLPHGNLKGANILVSNDAAPRACLVDFGLMTMVFDPVQPMACSAKLAGDTVTFMSPELLVPSKFGTKDLAPTPEADIYAFGLVIFQVLTGETPFRTIRQTELGWSVVQGLRPAGPANASSVGFSDLLWVFVQRCWGGDAKLRPKVTEVVTHLGREAANWHGLMPPCALAENVTSDSEEPMSDSEDCAIFPPSSDTIPESPTESQTASGPPGRPSTPSARYSDPPQEGPQEVIAKPFEEPPGDQYVFEIYPHLSQRYEPPPSQPPQKKRKGLMHYLNSKFPGSFRRPSISPGQPERRGSSSSSRLNLAGIAAESQRRPDQDLIDKIDGMLDHIVSDRDRHDLLNILCKLCSRQRMIPKSMHMTNCLNGELIEEYDGGHASVFRDKHEGCPVAIKIVRLYLTSDFDKSLSGFCREAVVWRHLRHPNILPLLGVNLERHRLAMISEWMDHGNIAEFVERHKGINRVQLLVDAANGLEYMHSLHMVHGDLKGANVLINKSFRACLADFGLSTIVTAERSATTNPSFVSIASNISLVPFAAGGTTRWMSPELLDPGQFGVTDYRPTKRSDCYALGMLVYEVLCGNPPYWEIQNIGAVIIAIMNGGRPQKPEAIESLGFTNELWEIVQRCWSVEPGARPDVGTVLSHLNHATWSWERRRLVELRTSGESNPEPL